MNNNTFSKINNNIGQGSFPYSYFKNNLGFYRDNKQYL